jgi:hypothetical protein
MKHSANRAVVGGKRIVLVDDSIVRGTTSRKIVQMMRDAGAREVHFRIASPPITHPDYYGIDTPERDKLLAATHDSRACGHLSVRIPSPSFRSTESIERWGSRDAIRCGPSSQTIASPATIRRRSPTSPHRKLARPVVASGRSHLIAVMAGPMTGTNRPLSDRIALVTGASRGIGAAVALELAHAGAHIVAVARTVGGLEELDDKIKANGSSATLVPLDMKDSDGIARLALALNDRYHRLDVLIGNAGILGALSPLSHYEPKDWDNIIAVNVTANWHLIAAWTLSATFTGWTCGIPDVRGRTFGPRLLGPLCGVKGGAGGHGAHLCRRNRHHECTCQFVRARTHADAHVPRSFPRRRSIDAADTRRDRQGDPAICLPSFGESGKLYDYRDRKLKSFQPPA